MFLKCTGQGLPTGNLEPELKYIYPHLVCTRCIIVILDAPVGQSSDLWVMVEPLIAKWTKV